MAKRDMSVDPPAAYCDPAAYAEIVSESGRRISTQAIHDRLNRGRLEYLTLRRPNGKTVRIISIELAIAERERKRLELA